VRKLPLTVHINLPTRRQVTTLDASQSTIRNWRRYRPLPTDRFEVCDVARTSHPLSPYQWAVSACHWHRNRRLPHGRWFQC
jgi:hypothetical protein